MTYIEHNDTSLLQMPRYQKCLLYIRFLASRFEKAKEMLRTAWLLHSTLKGLVSSHFLVST